MSIQNEGDTILVVKHTRLDTLDTAVMTSNGSAALNGDSNLMPYHNEFHCSRGDLLGPLGLFVQGLLAFIAFASLIVKRFCEPKGERRPWKIWFFDTSKQAIGAAVIHFANVFLADMFQGDPCTWYFISFLLDSTIGLVIIWIGIRICQFVVKYRKQDSLMFGEYGNPPACQAWIGQCGLYILVMIIEKLLMTLLVLFDFWREVRRFIMSPIKDPHLELVIVIFIVPFIVNAFIFWVVDNFLKRKVFKTTPTNVALVTDASGGSDGSIKYHKASDKVSYYNKVADSDESDGLLSLDEVDTVPDRSTHAHGTFHLIEVESSAPEDAGEDHGLLSAT